MTKQHHLFGEIIQFVPVIIFAFSFLVKGDVDLNRAHLLFLISGIISVLITVFLIANKVLLNPILLGTNIWLVLGAIAFSIPQLPVATLIGNLKAVGLYICIFVIAILFSFGKRTGFIGMVHSDLSVIKKTSFIMLIFSAIVLVWSYFFIDNIRVGGGVPFILLNITRRILIKRYSVSTNTGGIKEKI